MDRKEAIDLCKKMGKNFLIIDEKFRKDEKVIYEAVKSYPSCFQLVDKSLKCQKWFCLKILDINAACFEYFNTHMRKDYEICKKALLLEDGRNGGYRNFYFLPKHFKNEKEFALIAIKNNLHCYSLFCTRLQLDLDICNIMIDLNIDTYRFFHYKMKSNKDIIMKMLDKDIDKISAVPSYYRDESLCDYVCSIAPFHYSKFKKEVMSLETVKKIIAYDRDFICDMPGKYFKELITSDDMAIRCLEKIENIEFLPEEFKTEKVIKPFMNKLMSDKYLLDMNVNLLLFIPKSFFSTAFINMIYKHFSYLRTLKIYDVYKLPMEFRLFLLEKDKRFMDFCEKTNSFFIEAVQFNEEVLDYITDIEFKDILYNALIEDSLDTIKEDYPEYFKEEFTFKNGKISLA